MATENKKEKQKLSTIIKNNFLMIKKIGKHSPQLVALMVGQGIFYGLANSLNIIYFPLILNALERGEGFMAFIPYFALGLLSLLLRWGYGRINYLYMRPWMVNRLHYRMHEEIFHKAMEADLACFDDPDFYNDFVWAMDEAEGRAVKVLESLQGFISFLISLSSSALIMTMVNVWVVLLLLAHSVINFFIRKMLIKLNKAYSEEIKPVSRKLDYINRIFHLSDYAKELRTTRLSEKLIEEYDESQGRSLEINLRYNKKFFPFSMVSYFLDMAFQSAVYLIMTALLFAGKPGVLPESLSPLEGAAVTVGGFAIILSQLWRLSNLFNNFGRYFNDFAEHSLYIEKYNKFMTYEPKVKTGSLSISDFESLEFQNVSFRYTDKGENVLKNISFSFKKGEKIALVGYNGAGKSTLIKLILRFYDPTEGRILLNGIDLKEYNLKEYRDSIGAVFQDFKLFSASIGENVLGRSVERAEDREAVLQALRRISFDNKLSELEKSIDTMLTKEFDDDGINLSGGEAQKVAIARAFVRPYMLTIMDEPSAALDPGAEYALNRSIAENLKGQTVIFISHRLSTTRMSDKIFMFDSGRLIEEGAHEELLAFGGKYAEMFEVQSKNYKKQ